MFASDGESRERGGQRAALGMRRGGNGEISPMRRESKGEVRAGAGLEVRNMPGASRSWAQPGKALGTSVPASKRGPEANPAASIIGPLESNLPCASPP